MSVVWALLLIIIGAVAIAVPLAASTGILVIIAWLLLVAGVVQGIYVFQSKGISILWGLLAAGIYIAAGAFLLIHPLKGIAALTLLLAVFFVADGLTHIIAFFQNRSAPGAGWGLLNGIVTLFLGVLVWVHWPSSALWVIGTLVGISMIMTGTARLMAGFAARRS
jgi:uncharacterized membrane protein HdeD (DUF308 family)